MEIVLLLTGLVLGLCLGGGLGWLARQAAARQQVADVERQVADVERQVVEVERELTVARHEADLASVRTETVVAQVREAEAATRAEVQADLASALATVDELRAALEAARAQHAEVVEHHRRAAGERERQEASQAQVLKTLSPVADQLRAMQARVDDMEKQRSRQHGELAEQLRTTQHTVTESKRAADSLASALSNNAVRGVWGETQLRTLVESAGLLNRVDFTLQASIESDSGARRPDMVINLPGGKQMAIDAKVPYKSFLEATNASGDQERRQQHRVAHARQVRAHVDALAAKSYWTGLAASPEFTVAFIPNDQLLAVALEADPSLLEYSFGKGIVLATPTNLWAILKTVVFTWRQDVLTEDAQQLFHLGQELYRRITTMAEHADKLRRSLESTIKHYNSFASSLEQRVLVTARKIDRMDGSALIPAPAEIELAPKALTSGEFEAIADIERAELDFAEPQLFDAEVVDDADTA